MDVVEPHARALDQAARLVAVLGDDPAAAYPETARALAQAWRQPGRLDRPTGCRSGSCRARRRSARAA